MSTSPAAYESLKKAYSTHLDKEIEPQVDYDKMSLVKLSRYIDELLARFQHLLNEMMDNEAEADQKATDDQRAFRKKEEKEYYRLAGRQAIGIIAALVGGVGACFEKDANMARMLTAGQGVLQGVKEVAITFPQAELQKLQGFLSENQERLQKLAKEDNRVDDAKKQLENCLQEASKAHMRAMESQMGG